MGAHRAANRHAGHRAHRGISKLCFAATSAGPNHRLHGGIVLPRGARFAAVLQEYVFAVSQHQRDARGHARLPTFCGRRVHARRIARWRRLRQQAERFAVQRRPRTSADGALRLQHQRPQYRLASFAVRHRPASRLHRCHQSVVRRRISAAALFLRGGIHARVFAESCELFQSGVLLVRKLVRPERSRENTRRLPHRARRHRRQSIHHGRWIGQYLDSGPARFPHLYQR